MDALQLNEGASVQQLLTHIVMNYLAQLYCVCVVWNNLDPNQIVNIKIDFMQMVENYPQTMWLKYEAFKGNQTNIDDLIRMGIDNDCQAFIATPNSVIDFLNAFENVRFTAEKRFHRVHVVVLPTNRDEAQEYINRILNHASVLDIPNILIISPSSRKNPNGKSDDLYDLITSRFVTRYNGTDPHVLDTFDVATEKFVENVDLFPEKMSNLEGRIVRIAMFNYKPYAIWTEVPAGQGNANAIGADEEMTLSIDGTETLAIIAFCQLYNCTLAASIDEAGEWGTIADNSTGDGVLGAVVERRADVGFTALYSWYHEFQFLEFSSVITRSGITCICPKPRLLSGWLLPAEPFSRIMWTAELISFMSIFMTIAIIKVAMRSYNVRRKVDISWTFFQTLGMFLLQATKIASKHLPEIIIALIALLTSQLIANAYSGGLASIMTVPRYETPIDTAHQLAERNMEWGATHDAWIFSILDAILPDLIKLRSTFQAIPFEALVTRTKTRNFCFSVERLPYGHYAVGDYIDENSLNFLRLMHYDMYFEFCVIMFYKTWPFKSVFDLLVLHLIESGIQRYWELVTVAGHSNSKIQLGISISRERANTGPISLSLDHVSGAFILWGVGIFCATFVYVLEFIWHLNKRRKMSNVITVAPFE